MKSVTLNLHLLVLEVVTVSEADTVYTRVTDEKERAGRRAIL